MESGRTHRSTYRGGEKSEKSEKSEKHFISYGQTDRHTHRSTYRGGAHLKTKLSESVSLLVSD
jgi:hypothetical protein